MDEKQETIIDEIAEFRSTLFSFANFRKKMIQGVELTIKEWEIFTQLFNEISIGAGMYSQLIKEITGLETIHTSIGQEDIWNWALSLEANILVISALDNCISATSRTIGKIKKDIDNGLRDKKTGSLISTVGKTEFEVLKAFIAHGGETKARNKLYRFLNALKVQVLIIEEEPKEGRSVNEQVEYYLNQADCAIILGTADDKELKDGKLYPRRNVYIEIGRFQEKFPQRIIYLLEEGASFPSDISEKLYTRFTQENMDEAFITVAREFSAFNILKAIKPAIKE